MAPRFAERVIQAASDTIYLVRGIDESDEDAWYYIQIERPKLLRFIKLCSQGVQFDLADFGRIIASGYGERPIPYDIIKERIAA